MNTDLKSGFLVAAPSLQCPFFNHTLVLLVDHREDGSLGFVVNKCADVSFGEVLTKVGITAEETSTNSLAATKPVMVGGPVSPNTGWVVFDARYDDPSFAEGVLELDNGLGVCANMDMLEEIARGDGPPSYLMMLGYAGWGPGQLDDEIREGAWISVDMDPKVVFDTPVADRWNAAFASLGIDPARMMGPFVADA